MEELNIPIALLGENEYFDIDDDDDDDDDDDYDLDVDEDEVHEPSKKKPKTRSSVWKNFTKLGPAKEDGIDRVKCVGCGQIYKGGGKVYGTSHLKRHILKCVKLQHENIDQIMVDMQGKLKSRKIDPMVSREMCARAIIEHDLPFKFVEFRRIRNWIRYLNPDAVPISRNTCKADVLKIFMREKEKLKGEMSKINSRISLTSDLWTSCTTEGYITLTAHYVDTNWKLTSKILNFCHMPPPHSGHELTKKILHFLSDWGIEKKIFSITLDNAYANDKLQGDLKKRLCLKKWLLCDGQFFHVRCSAHILNLIVQDGLTVASSALQKIRESVKYVRGSEGRMLNFKKCIEEIGGVQTSAGLCLDVSTRWNSTYLMLDRALKYKRAFENFGGYERDYDSCPTEEEWERGAQICQVLLPFYKTTTLISGTSYPTSNLYFMQVWKIQCVINDCLRDEDEVIKKMAKKMNEKFLKYWEEYSVVLALGAVLDPRAKLDTLSYCYSKVEAKASTCEEKMDLVKRNLYMLFDKYSSKVTSLESSQTSTSTSKVSQESKTSLHDLSYVFNELDRQKKQQRSKIGKSELDTYLDEATLDFGGGDMDVLKWWKDNKSRFPNLSIMARDLLSIPITTVASESSFSIGSHVLNKYRNRLLSKNVEALICTRNWMLGFAGEDGDDDGDDGDHDGRVEPPKATASNPVDVEDNE